MLPTCCCFDLPTCLRRRRAGDKALDAEVLRLIVDDAGGGELEPSAGAERHSPRTREALAAMFAERRPTRNMCVPPFPVPTLHPLCSMIMQESCRQIWIHLLHSISVGQPVPTVLWNVLQLLGCLHQNVPMTVH